MGYTRAEIGKTDSSRYNQLEAPGHYKGKKRRAATIAVSGHHDTKETILSMPPYSPVFHVIT